MLSALAGLAYLPVGVPTIPDQFYGVVAGNSSDDVIDVHTAPTPEPTQIPTQHVFG